MVRVHLSWLKIGLSSISLTISLMIGEGNTLYCKLVLAFASIASPLFIVLLDLLMKLKMKILKKKTKKTLNYDDGVCEVILIFE